MSKYSETFSEEEIRKAGLSALQEERGNLIDNCYRAGLIKSWCSVPESTKELRQLWSNYINKSALT